MSVSDAAVPLLWQCSKDVALRLSEAKRMHSVCVAATHCIASAVRTTHGQQIKSCDCFPRHERRKALHAYTVERLGCR